MSQSWNIGDVVKLKSGGPIMTIINVPGGGIKRYECAYFINATEFKTCDLPAEALRVAQPLSV